MYKKRKKGIADEWEGLSGEEMYVEDRQEKRESKRSTVKELYSQIQGETWSRNS